MISVVVFAPADKKAGVFMGFAIENNGIMGAFRRQAFSRETKFLKDVFLCLGLDKAGGLPVRASLYFV